MIEVVAMVCFITEPTKCKDVHLSFAIQSITPQQCMMFGQVELAKWTLGNPNWIIRKFSCGPAGRFIKT